MQVGAAPKWAWGPSTLSKNLSFYKINPFANESRDRVH